jgi:hypothetical protein
MIASVKRGIRPQIDGVILIDCWDYSMYPIHEIKDRELKIFYQNLVDHLKQFNIQYVVNAMTNRDINQVDSYLDQELVSHLPNCTIDTWHEFETCLTDTLNGSVTQWYMAGQAWKLCIHHNDIGLKRIARETHSGFDFYADQLSFRNETNNLIEHQDFVEDENSWEYLKSFGYRLIQH